MASLREIKKRIKSAKNIGQVTKALEMVSAVKMRKAQEQVLASRPYITELSDSLSLLQNDQSGMHHPLLENSINPTSKITLVILAPDKGLAGALITNLWREVARFASSQSKPVEALVWGKKAASIAVKCRLPIVADVTPSQQYLPSVQQALLSRLVIDSFLDGQTSEVWLAYNKFVNTMVQQPVITKFLPLIQTQPHQSATNKVVTFEPSPTEVLNFLVPHYLEMLLTQTIKDSIAAEHSARMVAMKKARDNASNIVSDYQLVYNKTRQEKITNEIADLTSNMLTI